jgi:hypothetical protein
MSLKINQLFRFSRIYFAIRLTMWIESGQLSTANLAVTFYMLPPTKKVLSINSLLPSGSKHGYEVSGFAARGYS